MQALPRSVRVDRAPLHGMPEAGTGEKTIGRIMPEHGGEDRHLLQPPYPDQPYGGQGQKLQREASVTKSQGCGTLNVSRMERAIDGGSLNVLTYVC